MDKLRSIQQFAEYEEMEAPNFTQRCRLLFSQLEAPCDELAEKVLEFLSARGGKADEESFFEAMDMEEGGPGWDEFVEVLYQMQEHALLTHTPFVGVELAADAESELMP